MTDSDLLAAVASRLDDETALRRFTAQVLPGFFGTAVLGAVDWRRAGREVVERLDLPATAAQWFAAAQTVADEIHLWSQADDDDDSWFTREEQGRRRAIAAGEACDA